ncbi:hypothetical protein GH714_001413 [Hevea brasiliensis]|uniref:GAG-pre-integrase domain-containing protein n=1 Tax=Hevea brasiliensis TaxID=3981 RepID=A0A6A6KFN1_HEVBR|nr:hypothetical protein GH714_001413 [Hevea brasiliensis]
MQVGYHKTSLVRKVIESGIDEPKADEALTDAQQIELEKMKLKDLEAKNYLFQAIDRPILETIFIKETSKAIWDSMKKKYQGSSRVKRAQLQALRRDFETLQMKDGEKTEGVTIVENIAAMTPKFDYVVCSIEESKDIDALSLDELQSPLLAHEQKMNRSSTIEEQALKASTSIHLSSSRGRGRGRGKGRGRRGRGNGDGSSYFKADDEQVQIKGRGHDQQFDKSKAAETTCGSKSSFSFLNKDFHSIVSFGDCSTVNVLGKGDIEIRTKNGLIEKISNVLYVPNLKSNLLSAGQLQEKGYIITIQKDACENRLFPLKIETVRSCLVAEVKDPSWLWHFRYGHLSFGGLKTPQEKNMVTRLPQIITPS